MRDKMRSGWWLPGVIFAFLLFSAQGVRADDPDLTLATTQWPPYTGHDLKSGGYASEIVTEAFERAGYAVEIKFYPWSDALAAARSGQVDALFPVYHEAAREADFLFSAPMAKSPLGLFKRSSMAGKTPLGRTKPAAEIDYPVDPRVDREAALRGLDDHTFGVVTGYANPSVFETEGFDVVKAVNDRENMENLMEGRIDLAVMDRRVGRFLIREYHLWRKDQVAFLEPPLAVKKLFLAVSVKAPEASSKKEAFDRALEALRADGVLERIRKSHLVDAE